MAGADFVLINKLDLAKPGQIDEIKGWFSKEFPDKEVMVISAKTGENMESVYGMMK
jgi:Ni2+-binding GTPase involved in maturation of urease and hydrogenase